MAHIDYFKMATGLYPPDMLEAVCSVVFADMEKVCGFTKAEIEAIAGVPNTS